MTCSASHVRVTGPAGEAVAPRQPGCTCPAGERGSSAARAVVEVQQPIGLSDLARPFDLDQMSRGLSGGADQDFWLI